MTEPRAAVILAAGFGSRMRSQTPKVLHEIGGKTMVAWVVDLARDCGADTPVVVCGAHGPEVAAAAEALGAATAVQDPPLGTGHAVQAAEANLRALQGGLTAGGVTVVLYADTPLIRPETVMAAYKAVADGAGVAVIGFEPNDPGAYGRLILDEDGDLARIVEAKDAEPHELAVRLCNSGVIAAQSTLLFDLLAEVTNDNAKGEYYLTDIVGLARAAGRRAVVVHASADEVLGVNDRAGLAAAEAAFQRAKRAQVMADGATLTAPDTVFFSHDTALDADVTVEPHVVFGPGVTVEAGARIAAFSHLEGARVRAGAMIGPYARLRPGADVGPAAKVGNFVEIKKAVLGAGAKVSHLSYIGDASIGAEVNIGAGTITCNYDGFSKHRTEIGAGAFIGSQTALVAPVRVGAGAYTATGSVITEDVADDALALARTRQTQKPGWAAARRAARSPARNTEPGAAE